MWITFRDIESQRTHLLNGDNVTVWLLSPPASANSLSGLPWPRIRRTVSFQVQISQMQLGLGELN